MRINPEIASFRHARQFSVKLLLCVLVLSLVAPAGCVIAQDTVAGQLELAKQQAAELEAKVAQLQAELQKQHAIAAQSRAQAEAATAEAAQLRAQLLLAKSEQDKGLKSLVETTEALKAVRAENAALKAENQRLQNLAAKAGVLPKPEDPFGPTELAKPPAAPAHGVVAEVKDDGSVVVSLGTKDGLRNGDQLHIYRDLGDYGVYVGQIEITEAQSDRSTCKFVSRQDTPRKGDKVVTRI